MRSRLLQCRFTLPSIAVWRKALESDWESQFSAEVLEKGRKIYKNSLVCSWDLTPKDLVVHKSCEDRNKISGVYAIIELKANGRFDIRCSVADLEEGQAIAIAGFYELEEWMMNEYPDGVDEAKLPPPSKEKHFPATFAPKTAAPPTANFWIESSIVGQECRMVPYWALKDRKQKVCEAKMTSAERLAWIRLANAARKAGFIYDPQDGFYSFLFENFENIPYAVDAFEQGLMRGDHLEHSLIVQNILKGPREPLLKTLLQQKDQNLSARPTLFLGNQALPTEVIRKLLKQNGESIIDPWGWIRLAPSQLELLKDWQIFFESDWDNAWPSYMLFSVFVRGNAAFLDNQVLDWQSNFEKAHEATGPVSEHAFLRPYQVEGVEWMERLFAAGGHPLLADEMGLGKTLQVLEALSRLKGEALPSLIVAPASVLPVWAKEVRHFYPDTKVIEWTPDWSGEGTPLLLISYAKLQRYKDVIRAHEFKAIVLDEAQLIKNPSAKTSQAIFSLQSQYRIALSGTPIENHLRDLWSIFRFLMPGLLGGQKMFERFMSGSMGTARLRQQLHPFILRRLKQDVLKELPEKVEVVLPCPLTEAQKSLYKRIVEGVHESFGSDFPKADQALHFLTVLLRLRQITCDPALVDPSKDGLEYSGKLMILMQRVAELIENGEKVVIFSQFTSLLERLKKILHQHFPATPVYEITGATSSKSRGVVVQDFQNDRRSAIFLGSLKAAGTGITLHSASYVFMLDPWWNPALEAQAVDRLHRLGQKNTVFVYRLVAPGTVEAKVQALQQSKKELFREVFSDLPLLDQLKSHFENLNALIDFNDEPNE